MGNGVRVEDIIYFNGDDTAERRIVKGTKSKVVDEAYEKQDVVDTIHKAVIDGTLKKATRVADSRSLKYFFQFSEYDQRRGQNKKSVVKIIVPNEVYNKNDSSILALDSITQTNIRMRKSNHKKIAAIATLSIALTVPLLSKGLDHWEKNAEARYQQEMEYQKQQVEELTGKTPEEIVNSSQETEVIPEEQSMEDLENYYGLIKEKQNQEQDAITFGK